MELQRVKLLDDHIFVLRSMVETISQELSEALEERRQLLGILGIEESFPTVPVKDDGYRWSAEVSKLDLGDDMSEGMDVAEEYFREPSDDAHPIDNADCHSEVHFSEDLPTPRGAACLEHPATEEAVPDMNNALSDSDDDETPRENVSQDKQLKSVHAGDDAGKITRPTSSLNNADSDSDMDEDQSAKPRNWISNTVFTSSVVSMVQSRPREDAVEVEEGPRCEKMDQIDSRFLSNGHSHSNVSLRSYDATLMEKAIATVRLSSDLKRLRLELFEREAHIEFMHEKYNRYKEASKKEIQKRERETRELKTQRDQASSARFVMFCKLQAAEARVTELEEHHRELWESTEAVSRNDASDGEEALSDGVVTMDVHAQRVARSKNQEPQQPLKTRPYVESVEQHPLHDSLRETCAQLLEAQKRGDKLQRRLQKLEKKMSTQKTSSTVLTNRNDNGTVAKTTKRTARQGKREKSEADLGMPRSRSGEKSSVPASKAALRSRHERESSSHLPHTGARSATRLSKPKRWSS